MICGIARCSMLGRQSIVKLLLGRSTLWPEFRIDNNNRYHPHLVARLGMYHIPNFILKYRKMNML